MIAVWNNTTLRGWMGGMGIPASEPGHPTGDTRSGLPHFAETIHATTRYLQALTQLSDEDVRRPSALPGWTRGHVITHVARNADAMTNLLHWALTGRPTPMYQSQERRDADIDAGAGRTSEELREDSAASWGRLLQAANEIHQQHLDVQVTRTPGSPPFATALVGPMRRIEVEVHHADLLLDYTARDWPEDFARRLVDRRTDDLADGPSMVLSATDVDGLWKLGPGAGPEISGALGDLAWWLIGRGRGEGLVSSSGELPRIPKWR
jgi:maleylpyruvate isomerase